MVTVAEWVGSWADAFPTPRSEVTAVHDGYMLAPFVRAYGRRPLESITRLEAQRWATSHRSQVRYLRRAWRRAVAAGVVPENVWDRVELPRKPRRSASVLTEAQLDGILERSRARGGWWCDFADVIEVAAFTGARCGGLAGLRRGAVDLSARRLSLTEKGERTRTVVVGARALVPLERAVSASVVRVEPDPLLWLSPLRRPLDRGKVGEAWRAVRGEYAGSFHSLRHFAATWLLARGCAPADVAVQLGHVDAAGRPYTRLVERVYGHPDHGAALERVAAAAEADL